MSLVDEARKRVLEQTWHWSEYGVTTGEDEDAVDELIELVRMEAAGCESTPEFRVAIVGHGNDPDLPVPQFGEWGKDGVSAMRNAGHLRERGYRVWVQRRHVVAGTWWAMPA